VGTVASKPRLFRSFATKSAAALQDSLNALSVEIDGMRTSSNSRFRLLSRSASMCASTAGRALAAEVIFCSGDSKRGVPAGSRN
jgi:hypothetical protein